MLRKHRIAESRVAGVLTDLKRLSPDFIHLYPRPIDDIIQLLYPVSLIEMQDLTSTKVVSYLHNVGIDYDWPDEKTVELAGFILFKNGHGLIFTEKSGHPGFCRFTKAHELGHFWDFWKKHQKNSQRAEVEFACRDLSPGPAEAFNEGRTLEFDYVEVRANQFAAELLMPAALMVEYPGLPQSAEEMVAGVSDRFGVSRAAARIRLKEFGAIQNDNPIGN